MPARRSFEVGGALFEWDIEAGNLSFFGLPSALFWIDPSLRTLLHPLAQEIGGELFRLLVARSASLGTEEDYEAMVTVLASNFVDGFHAWGNAVSAAGWGSFEILEYAPDRNEARVRVTNPWELRLQRRLSERIGCPLAQGKITGIFTQAFGTTCWADELVVDYEAEPPFVELHVHPSDRTLEAELEAERRRRMQTRERTLADEIEEKTRALLEQKRLVQEASQSKSRFIASMSHEMLTPLNGIQGALQLLEITSDLDEEGSEYCTMIRESGRSLEELISRVLAFAELPNSAPSADLPNLELDPVLRAAIETIAPLAKQHAIRVEYQPLEECPMVQGESDYVRDIVVSFLSNACKYGGDGHVIELRVVETPNLVRIEVADRGPGIPAEQAHLVFEPFERLGRHDGTIPGVGVGLSIARMMAELMGATVGFDPNPGGGTVFWLAL